MGYDKRYRPWLMVGCSALSVLCSSMPAQPSVTAASRIRSQQQPTWLTFAELRSLADDPYPDGATRDTYHALWKTPLVSNAAYEDGVQPHHPSSPQLGSYVRVVTWNIEKSLQMDAVIAAWTDAEAYAQQLNGRTAPPGSRRRQQALEEREWLESADIILLQEMDIGVKRSGYRNAAQDLAEALGMNYAYLPQQLELDPVVLGVEPVHLRNGEIDTEATAHYAADPTRYRGLFGLAVLSRYPIVFAEGFQLLHQPYDWYWQERSKTSFLEQARRAGARGLFGTRAHREIKLGGRCYFRVDVQMPELPEQRVSIINIHLEIKATPQDRVRQLAEILRHIKSIRHPVILAGDFNATSQDISPTSTPRAIERTLQAPEFWLGRVLDHLSPYALLIRATRMVAAHTKNYQNPTAVHIPVLAPNRTGELFRMLERFRFADGGAFDFRGDARRSAGRTGKLSNSNERDRWKYKTTFRIVHRTITNWIGTYRLDWMFIKAYAHHPRDRQAPYRFAPHFGRTLNALNKYLRQPLSDHDPSIVDLPLTEPTTHVTRRKGD